MQYIKVSKRTNKYIIFQKKLKIDFIMHTYSGKLHNSLKEKCLNILDLFVQFSPK